MRQPADFLVNDAYRRIWCGPGQDRQYIVAPTRFSPRLGALSSVKIGMRVYNLPTQGEFYHCFMIGDLPPVLVGMDTIVNKWVAVRGHCIATSLLVDLYTKQGKHFPTHRAYFLYTGMGALVIAFLHTPKIANLGLEQPYIRWRSGLAMDDSSKYPFNGGIEIEGIVPTTQNEFILYQNMWRAAQQKQGYAWAFVNGMRVKDINPTTAKLGDVLEYYRDATVKEVVEVLVKDILPFDSRMDEIGKYLITRAGLGETVDFYDDIDIYLLRYTKAAVYTGYYYHFNQPDSIRMVTHRDYAIGQAYLAAYIEYDRDWTWNHDLRLELIIRDSGKNRPLPDEAHHIKDLFRLPEPQRIKAMIGEKSMEVWQAAELEDSFYPKVMAAPQGGITRLMVEKALGYNAIGKRINNTPIKVTPGTDKWATLPEGLWDRSTIYEYAADGTLLGWYLHDASYEYPIRNNNTRYLEGFYGYGGDGSSTDFDVDGTVIDPTMDYRFYISHIYNGVRKNDWQDITGDERYYKIQGGKVVWYVDRAKFSTAVRNSVDFLAYDLQLNYRDDLLAFSLNADEIRVGRVSAVGVLDIPFGQTNIWMNGHELVPKIDYYFEFPEFCIVNKAYLKPGPVQDIHLRSRSFCKSDMSARPPAETGFVAYRQLSHNSRYNVREDKVNHVCIGGAIYTRDELGFTEDNQTLPEIARNGLPYMVQHPVINMLGVTDTDTYTLLEAAEVIDKKVEDYLTVELPLPEQPNPTPIEYWWQVFSPFTTKLIYDMLNGILPMDEFKGEYSDDWLRKRLAGYDWILKYDPALNDVDEQFVVIHPHPETGVIELNVYQYRVLDRAIKLFLNNNVVLNRHLVIVEEGFEHDQRDHPHPHQTWESVGLS